MMNTIKLTSDDSIQNVLDNAPLGDLEIFLSKGRYEEKIFVNRKNVTIIGEDGVEIVFSDHHGTIRDGKVFGTGDSATFTVGAPNFKAINIKFSNSFDYLYWHNYKKENPKEHIDTQAVAFRTVAGADNTILDNCTFYSYQDTIYADVGYHLFKNCTVFGNVDYIFGAGESTFEECEICSIGEGFVAAPSTFTSSKVGFVFKDCKLTSQNLDDESVYLARPWHPSGSINRTPMVKFIDCEIGKHIKKELWTGMNSRTPDGTERYWLPEESRFSISRS